VAIVRVPLLRAAAVPSQHEIDAAKPMTAPAMHQRLLANEQRMPRATGMTPGEMTTP
jgi:hypothetical protein